MLRPRGLMLKLLVHLPLVVSGLVPLRHHIVSPSLNDAFREWRKPSNCLRRSFCEHNMRYSIKRRMPHLIPTHWWPRPESERAIVLVRNLSIPDGKYVFKNRAAGIYWKTEHNPMSKVRFLPCPMNYGKKSIYMQVSKHTFLQLFKVLKTKKSFRKWDITQDNGNISIRSPYAPSSWVGAEITGSTVPVPWRLIPADDKLYY